MLHAGELEIPVIPGSTELIKFSGKMKKPMEKMLDLMHIPKFYYISTWKLKE